ncbi:hypothetical protein [Paenibacillus sp. MMS20-IR301]|uniref:hypothetical protein n=1 Tax=Paenibacillus sp. MMS20-IR301 TaxID=2895946 RepID=UPI0028EC8131|nr:hypothetical protein [Paenibacillus sp. MMS20-IR301]WNS43431.1 hypothetical protein LOS79_31595 [Paenibacillus sp. MMS20-IR301]
MTTRHRVKKTLLGVLLVTLILPLLLPPGQAAADAPYKGYTWSQRGSEVRSINGYLYDSSIDPGDTEAGVLKNPESLYIGEDDSLYIVDTGNSRILHMDQNGGLIKIIGDAEGSGKLLEPKGVYVKADGTVYVADTKNQRIAVFTPDGKFEKEFLKPESTLLGANFSYSPSKLIVDKRDYMYVVSDGNTQGLMQIDSGGKFKGFYGANHVGFSWTRLLIKLVATKDQQSQLATVRPSEFSNVDLDQEGFIYSTTLGEETNQIKRLSPVGVDTLNIGKHRYGNYYTDGPFSMASFMGISIDANGFITALDLQSSRIFQYDKLGNLLFSFGGTGEQNGLFVTPSAVDQTSDGMIYVVDKGRGRVDRFRTTPFADLVHKASLLYVDGRYDEAETLWHEVLRLNANYDMAYLAIGKALYKAEKYKEAMGYFKLGSSKFDYSSSFREYRKLYIREHFTLFFTGAIVLLLVLYWSVPKLYRRFHIWLYRRRPADPVPVKEGL